ncbi:T9SS type A sorting domain-containing protein [Flavobacterium sp.]|uniref:T9SS type A sorting domain-containing protein n=1 Tax=Flavobacterium sp. TaxID=239 RepID=UPI003A92CBD9
MKLKITIAKFHLLFLFLVLSFTPIYGQTVRYVKEVASGTGDGSSWINASSDIQAMINLSETGDQVWIAEGVYKPERSPDNTEVISIDNRNNAFTIKNGVEVYGGFSASGEPAWEERDWEANVTILSGDIGNQGVDIDNAYHVVVILGTDEDLLSNISKLDGFTVMEGNANSAGSQIEVGDSYPVYGQGGGGIYNAVGYISVENCIVSNNNAIEGGGVYNAHFANVILNNTIIETNTATRGGGIFEEYGTYVDLVAVNINSNLAEQGGGVYTSQASMGVSEDVIIDNNTAAEGGGMYNYYTSIFNFSNITLSNNTATSNGGGVYNFNVLISSSFSESPLFKNVILSGNTAVNGGAMYNEYSSFQMENITMHNNSVSVNGGAIFNNNSGVALKRGSIRGNSANNGGGLYKAGGAPDIFISVLVAGNLANNNGGGIYVNSGSNLELMNVTIVGNNAANGGGIYNEASTPVITNTVIYGNSSEVLNTSTEPNYNFSLVQGVTDASNYNLDGSLNPIFKNPVQFSDAPTVNGNYELQLASLLINNGNTTSYYEYEFNNLTEELDLAGNNRIFNEEMGVFIDIGAYENTIVPDVNGILYVREGATGQGSSWDDASGDLQAMIDAPGVQQIWMGAGTYKPIRAMLDRFVIDYDNRDNSFYLNKELKIYGGFPSGNPSFDERDWNTNVTVLSGDIGVQGDASDNSYNVMVVQGLWIDSKLSPEAVVDGLTITDGFANGGINGGFGITRFNGAGIFNQYSDATFKNLKIQGNTSTYGGGGMYNENASPIVKNSVISGNTALSSHGGGIYNNGNSDAELTNVLITGNVFDGLCNFSSNPILTNVTISGNTGAAISGFQLSAPILRNTIIAGNEFTDDFISNAYYSFVSGATVEDENGNVDGTLDPLFVNAPLYTTAPFTGGDYSLQGNSPLIDSGSNSLYLLTGYNVAIDTDLGGNYRVSDYANGGVIDLGAYEQNGCFTSLPIVSSFSLCGESDVTDLFAEGLGIQWYTQETGGEPLEELELIETGIYYASQTIDGCESPRVPVEVSVSIVPVPVGAQTQVLGDDFPVNGIVSDLIVEGEGIQYYASQEDLDNNNPLTSDTVLVADNQYFVTQTVNSCESAPLIITVTAVMGLEDFEGVSLKYYPNPVISNLHIESNAAIDKVKVYTLTGQLVIEENWNQTENLLNISSLNQGNYIVSIIKGNVSKSFLIVKAGR